MAERLNTKGQLIRVISTYRTWYDKGIQVLSVIRNMEVTDLGILMAVMKYLFGDHISTTAILLIGACYWIFNAVVNTVVGMFWERNNGWQIEAEVFGKRNSVSRTVLVSPDGNPYDARDTHGDE